MALKKENKDEKKTRKQRERRSRESYKRVLKKYNELKRYNGVEERDEAGKIKKQKNIHWYFNSILDFKRFSHNGHILNVIIFYVCMRIERAQRITLYYDMIKRYKIDEEVAEEAIKDLRLYGKKFNEKYQKLTQTPISAETLKLRDDTQKVRGAVIHGDDINVAAVETQTDADKEAAIKEKEDAIASLLEYAVKLNSEVLDISGFQPFTDLSDLASRITTDDCKKSVAKLVCLKFPSEEKAKELKCPIK